MKVGDEMILKCAASFDPMLDIVFIWAIDLRVINFDTEWQHYERIMVGEKRSLLTSHNSERGLKSSFFPFLRATMAEAT